MTPEKIQELARQVGAISRVGARIYGPISIYGPVQSGKIDYVIDIMFTPATLERFVKLVAANEREECCKKLRAKDCLEKLLMGLLSTDDEERDSAIRALNQPRYAAIKSKLEAAAIRALSNEDAK